MGRRAAQLGERGARRRSAVRGGRGAGTGGHGGGGRRMRWRGGALAHGQVHRLQLVLRGVAGIVRGSEGGQVHLIERGRMGEDNSVRFWWVH